MLEYDELLMKYYDLSTSHACLQKQLDNLKKKYEQTCKEYNERIINLYNCQGYQSLKHANYKLKELVNLLTNEIQENHSNSAFECHLIDKIQNVLNENEVILKI